VQQWRSQNEAEEAMAHPETNSLRFLLVFCINFQLLERHHWLAPPEQYSWLRYCCAVMSSQFTHVRCFACLQRQVARLACWLFYRWSLLRNNNVATNLYVFTSSSVGLPDVLERQELFLNLLSKLVMSLILEKHLVVVEYFSASFKILE